MMKHHFLKRTAAVCTAAAAAFTLCTAMPQYRTEAASVDYPPVLLRMSTSDNSRNINISGYDDKSACVASELKNTQNENWRFDYVSTNSNGSFYRIVIRDGEYADSRRNYVLQYLLRRICAV